MVDFNELAIADCLKHPEFGIVSHQPSIEDPIDDRIMIRDASFKLWEVLASDCEWASEEESKDYWHQIATVEV